MLNMFTIQQFKFKYICTTRTHYCVPEKWWGPMILELQQLNKWWGPDPTDPPPVNYAYGEELSTCVDPASRVELES